MVLSSTNWHICFWWKLSSHLVHKKSCLCRSRFSSFYCCEPAECEHSSSEHRVQSAALQFPGRYSFNVPWNELKQRKLWAPRFPRKNISGWGPAWRRWCLFDRVEFTPNVSLACTNAEMKCFDFPLIQPRHLTKTFHSCFPLNISEEVLYTVRLQQESK